jgi:hypothetical protein
VELHLGSLVEEYPNTEMAEDIEEACIAVQRSEEYDLVLSKAVRGKNQLLKL